MRLNSLPVSEFSGSYGTSESIAQCFVLAHVSRQKTVKFDITLSIEGNITEQNEQQYNSALGKKQYKCC